jgi:hypothetical protein
MTDIKIPSGSLELNVVDAVKDADDAAPAVQKTEVPSTVETAAADPLNRIAEAVASGEIGQTEAVNRILTEVMASDMIKAAPEALRAEFEEMLKHLLKEDPHLRSLQAAVAPNEIE